MAAVPALADPSLNAKRAQAQQVYGQLQQLNGALEQTVQQYDLARVKYDGIERELRVNRYELRVAKSNLRLAQRRIAQRLVALYLQPKDSTIEVILGATSLDNLINRLNTAQSVTAQDQGVLQQVQQFRTTVRRSGAVLAHARVLAKRLLAEQDAKKRQFEAQIAEHNRLYASIKGQIAQIEAANQRRALLAARQAQARLAQEQAQQPPPTQVVGVTATAPSTSSAATPATVVAPTSSVGAAAVAAAMSQLGKPYQWAASGPDSFDCSGLTMWAYAQVGVSLPHSSYAQWNMGVPVAQDQLQPGDLVFFDGLGHVGIYIGGGQFVDAPHTGAVVEVASLSESWYASTYVGARRILG